MYFRKHNTYFNSIQKFIIYYLTPKFEIFFKYLLFKTILFVRKNLKNVTKYIRYLIINYFHILIYKVKQDL